MLGAICALHSGLAMDNRMCRFACLVLSPLSFCLIARHVTSCKGTSEKNWMVGKMWLMVSAMVLFFCAQRYAEMWRVSMLLTSISLVAYVCWRTFGKQGFAGICILATIYLGIFLPTMCFIMPATLSRIVWCYTILTWRRQDRICHNRRSWKIWQRELKHYWNYGEEMAREIESNHELWLRGCDGFELALWLRCDSVRR